MIRILFLAANPLVTDRLRLDEEARAIDGALRQSDWREQFEFIQSWAVRIADLQPLLLRHRPDIVHFSGHGSHDSEIVLQDDSGEAISVPTEALSRLFAILKENIRCVVLNACYSSEQAEGIADEIACVIGMSDAIGDDAAIQFASSFYGSLGQGLSVATAFDLGCNQIDLANLGEAHKPLLMGVANPEVVYFMEEKTVNANPQEAKPDADSPWWDQLQPGRGDFGDVGGDVIIANVGAGAKNVAVGKNIQQSVYEIIGQPAPDDQAIIEAGFVQLRNSLAQLAAQVDPRTVDEAEYQIRRLHEEISEIQEDEAPRSSTIIRAGDWLLENLPDIAEALASLFATPAVGRVVGRAGQEGIKWLRQRFG